MHLVALLSFTCSTGNGQTSPESVRRFSDQISSVEFRFNSLTLTPIIINTEIVHNGFLFSFFTPLTF